MFGFMKVFSEEVSSIVTRYDRRAAKDKSRIYSLASPACFLSSFEKNRLLLKILCKNFGHDFVNKKYLEVGCGTGTNLCQFITWGISGEELAGNDVYVPSLGVTKKRLPLSVDLQQGNFLDCSYTDKKFDVILFSTVLSSILDEGFRQECLRYAYNLLEREGIVIIYDFTYNNPWNKDVKKFQLKKIKQSAPWDSYHFQRVTLCPPLARKLEFFPFLIKMLTAVKLLDTHVIGFLKK